MAKYKIYKCDVLNWIEPKKKGDLRWFSDVTIHVPTYDLSIANISTVKCDQNFCETFSKWTNIKYSAYGKGNLIFPNQDLANLFYNRYLEVLPTLEPLLAPVITLEVYAIIKANKIRESVGRRVA